MKMITQFLIIIGEIEGEVNVDASSGVVIGDEVGDDYVTPREVAWREKGRMVRREKPWSILRLHYMHFYFLDIIYHLSVFRDIRKNYNHPDQARCCVQLHAHL